MFGDMKSEFSDHIYPLDMSGEVFSLLDVVLSRSNY